MILYKNKSRFHNLILMCLLDKIELKNIRISVKNKGIKVWIYDKISTDELKSYEFCYKKEINHILNLINDKNNDNF